MDTPKHTCLKLQVPNKSEPELTESIFVKGTWYTYRFDLSVTDGLHAWTCNPSEEEVRERASQWDQPVSDYIDLAESYLGFPQPGSVYAFVDAGNGQRRLSWTFVKEGTKLEWRWKCQPSPNSKNTTASILDFLMDANIRLSEEVVMKTESFKRLEMEAEKSLSQSEKFYDEKTEFESAIYAKFIGVLNSKKAKLRELRDRLAKKEASEKLQVDSPDKTQSFDESNEETSEGEPEKNPSDTSRDFLTIKARGRKRK